ncbi:MAG: hypothetical protein ACOVQC_01585 [Flavobacterium sp.]
MKNRIVFFILLILPFLGAAQNSSSVRMNQNMMRKMMTPQKIDFQKMVKREEARIEKLEIENIKLNEELEELKNKLAVSDDSNKEKITKKIEKLEKNIEENKQQIVNSKMFVLSYKKE